MTQNGLKLFLSTVYKLNVPKAFLELYLMHFSQLSSLLSDDCNWWQVDLNKNKNKTLANILYMFNIAKVK